MKKVQEKVHDKRFPKELITVLPRTHNMVQVRTFLEKGSE
jgi:hypothetical protein